MIYDFSSFQVQRPSVPFLYQKVKKIGVEHANLIVLTIGPQLALLFLLPFGRPRGFFGGRGPVGSFLDRKAGKVIMNEKDGYLYCRSYFSLYVTTENIAR